MKTLITVFNLACGQALPEEDSAPARRAQLAVIALGAALVMAALWGVAAGSAVPSLALANLYKLPLIVLLSGLGAVPAGLLAWKLVGTAVAFAATLAQLVSVLAPILPEHTLFSEGIDAVVH